MQEHMNFWIKVHKYLLFSIGKANCLSKISRGPMLLMAVQLPGNG